MAHADPIAAVAAGLLVFLVTAKLAGHLAVRLGQPAVLGELMGGVVLGNLSLVGFSAFDGFKTDPHLDMLARLGVLLLLFEVGLESTVAQMLKVGLAVVAGGRARRHRPVWPRLAGQRLLLPDASVYVHAFIGATLCATSVGITARVLQDLNSSRTVDARVILGAAVIDDVLGLVVLAIVGGIIGAANEVARCPTVQIGLILVKAIVFLVGSLVVGLLITPAAVPFRVEAPTRKGVLLATGLSLCFGLAWLADAIGLASIVGAFAAGLILGGRALPRFRRQGRPRARGADQAPDRVSRPDLLRADGHAHRPAIVRAPGRPRAGRRAHRRGHHRQAGLLARGVVGAGWTRLSIGIGMIPRGEVGLIFANIGLGLDPGRHAGGLGRDLFGDRGDGDRHDDGHAARAQMEPSPPRDPKRTVVIFSRDVWLPSPRLLLVFGLEVCVSACVIPPGPKTIPVVRLGRPAARVDDVAASQGRQPVPRRLFRGRHRVNAQRTADQWRRRDRRTPPRWTRSPAQPVAAWMGNWNPDIELDVKSCVWSRTRAGGLPVMILYNLPYRDCGLYSKGGAGSIAALPQVDRRRRERHRLAAGRRRARARRPSADVRLPRRPASARNGST